MVVELHGTCNGQEVKFKKVSEDETDARWQAVIPNFSGSYIIELWAADESGNETYYATVKLEYDGSMLRCRWLFGEMLDLFIVGPDESQGV